MAGKKQNKDLRTAASVLSIIGGTIIILVAVGFGLIGATHVPFIPQVEQGVVTGIFVTISTVGVVSGIIVLVGGIMFYTRPKHKTAWGVLVIVFSIISIVGGGGFLLGLILGIIGGALGLAWKPPQDLK